MFEDGTFIYKYNQSQDDAPDGKEVLHLFFEHLFGSEEQKQLRGEKFVGRMEATPPPPPPPPLHVEHRVLLCWLADATGAERHHQHGQAAQHVEARAGGAGCACGAQGGDDRAGQDVEGAQLARHQLLPERWHHPKGLTCLLLPHTPLPAQAHGLPSSMVSL